MQSDFENHTMCFIIRRGFSSVCNWTRTLNPLVRKRTLNDLAKLAERDMTRTCVRDMTRTYSHLAVWFLIFIPLLVSFQKLSSDLIFQKFEKLNNISLGQKRSLYKKTCYLKPLNRVCIKN